MFGTFGNQVYNPPTMKSFGGVYASEAYSNFHAPTPNTVTFASVGSETTKLAVKPLNDIFGIGGKKLVTGGKWTDDGAIAMMGLALKSGDDGLRVFTNKLLSDFGGLSDELTGLSDEALQTAVRTKMVGASVGNKLQITLGEMSVAGGKKGASESAKAGKVLAQNIVKGMKQIPTKTGNLADDLITTKGIRQRFSQCCGLIVSGGGDVTSAGVKLIDTPVGKQIGDAVTVTINNSGALAGGKEIASLGTKISGAGGKVWKIATPLFAAGIVFGGPNFIGTVLGFINIFGAWDEFDLANLGSDDVVIPECPNVGETCDSSTVLAQGCYCEDDDGDGEGTIEQQKVSVNYEGWLFFGALAVGGIVGISAINSLLFPRR